MSWVCTRQKRLQKHKKYETSQNFQFIQKSNFNLKKCFKLKSQEKQLQPKVITQHSNGALISKEGNDNDLNFLRDERTYDIPQKEKLKQTDKNIFRHDGEERKDW